MEYPPYQEAKDRAGLETSIVNAMQAILNADCVEAHKRDLLDICIWKWTEIDGKWNTRFRSEGAMKKENWKLVQHEHVFQRRNLIQQFLAQEDTIEALLNRAIGCLVTKREHELLTNLSQKERDIDGWERYRRAGIPVYDLKEKTIFLSASMSNNLG